MLCVHGDRSLIDGSKVANINAIRGMLIVLAHSGHRMQFADPDAYHCFMEAPVALEKLGESVLLALNASKQLSIEEAMNRRASEVEWNNWVSLMLSETKIASSQKLFQKMASCSVSNKDGVIVFSPSIKRRGAAWEGRGENFKISISASSEFKLIGQAALDGLSLCIPNVVA
jgi:CDI immunity protein